MAQAGKSSLLQPSRLIWCSRRVSNRDRQPFSLLGNTNVTTGHNTQGFIPGGGLDAAEGPAHLVVVLGVDLDLAGEGGPPALLYLHPAPTIIRH